MSAQAAELRLTPLKAARRRVCAACRLPILKGHKFTFDGSTVRHCNCSDPSKRSEGAPAADLELAAPGVFYQLRLMVAEWLMSAAFDAMPAGPEKARFAALVLLYVRGAARK
jgi:hypothetical protein